MLSVFAQAQHVHTGEAERHDTGDQRDTHDADDAPIGGGCYTRPWMDGGPAGLRLRLIGLAAALPRRAAAACRLRSSNGWRCRFPRTDVSDDGFDIEVVASFRCSCQSLLATEAQSHGVFGNLFVSVSLWFRSHIGMTEMCMP